MGRFLLSAIPFNSLVLDLGIYYADRMHKTTSLALLLTFCCTSSLAAVYKWVDEEGKTVFGDTPPEHIESEKVPERSVNIYRNIPPSSPYTNSTRQQQEDESDDQLDYYSSLNITSPKEDQAIRSNNGQLTITLDVQPPLDVASGHQIRIVIDDEIVGVGQSSSITLSEVYRGTHVLYAEIIDSQENIIQSSPSVTFHLLRRSALL